MEEIQKTENQARTELPGIIRAESATGDLRLHEFRSRVFHNTRFLRVWLPPGYDNPQNAGRRYPVFYLNDGQNLFEPATSFNGVEWQVDETSDRLIREGIVPPLIVVGLDNAGKDRSREYMPHRSLQPVIMRVQGSHYPDFLIVVVDVSNLKRNLLLFTQVRDLGFPVILALNMLDIAERAGTNIDVEALKKELGVPVVSINARNSSSG